MEYLPKELILYIPKLVYPFINDYDDFETTSSLSFCSKKYHEALKSKLNSMVDGITTIPKLMKKSIKNKRTLYRQYIWTMTKHNVIFESYTTNLLGIEKCFYLALLYNKTNLVDYFIKFINFYKWPDLIGLYNIPNIETDYMYDCAVLIGKLGNLNYINKIDPYFSKCLVPFGLLLGGHYQIIDTYYKHLVDECAYTSEFKKFYVSNYKNKQLDLKQYNYSDEQLNQMESNINSIQEFIRDDPSNRIFNIYMYKSEITKNFQDNIRNFDVDLITCIIEILIRKNYNYVLKKILLEQLTDPDLNYSIFLKWHTGQIFIDYCNECENYYACKLFLKYMHLAFPSKFRYPLDRLGFKSKNKMIEFISNKKKNYKLIDYCDTESTQDKLIDYCDTESTQDKIKNYLIIGATALLCIYVILKK